MPSTVIQRFVYDPDRHELWIQFVNGRRYVYEGVPETVANTLRQAFAKGVYFNSRIRDRFACRECPHEEEATES